MQEKINAWRRERYAADPEKYREQKRIAYANRNARVNNQIDREAEGAIIKGSYNPSDIRRAIT